MKIYTDGAISRLGDKFGHFVTVERYQDLHKLKKSIYSVRTTSKIFFKNQDANDDIAVIFNIRSNLENYNMFLREDNNRLTE